MIIRPATIADIPSLMSLGRSSTAAHWTEQQYQKLFQLGADELEHLVILVEKSSPDAGVLGFLVARHLAPEWELENIVVAETARRTGLGKRLLAALLARARETNSTTVFLEVRESNASARALYESSGFEQTGRRKAYYVDPHEDAILYLRTLA